MFPFRFMVIPDMLKNAPMFKKLDARIKVCSYLTNVKPLRFRIKYRLNFTMMPFSVNMLD